MKNFLSVFILCLVSVSAFAQTPFKFLETPEVEITRPYLNLEYTSLHALTLDKKDADAYFEGGLRYYYGYLKRLDVPYPKDYAAAAMWFHEAGMQNHPLGAYYSANMYIKAQGVKHDPKSAIWWLEKAEGLGVTQATQKLYGVYYSLSQNKQTISSYKGLYLKKAISYLDGLIARNYPYAYYDKAVLLLETNDVTRFIIADAEKLLIPALNLFIARDDQKNSYNVLKLMKYYKMPSYKNGLKDFNTAFPTKNLEAFK